ncbi:hypothetical protein BKA61DRAFT_597302 [Leptodontidium sp. MPI-SDFR-AT-0119]|nr:hypothetical protein BKA61DRAFT_597302 [Leptodontidium sp. MPI-SDFR-AT-0119]
MNCGVESEGVVLLWAATCIASLHAHAAAPSPSTNSDGREEHKAYCLFFRGCVALGWMDGWDGCLGHVVGVLDRISGVG